jgi:hypothetical protein
MAYHKDTEQTLTFDIPIELWETLDRQRRERKQIKKEIGRAMVELWVSIDGITQQKMVFGNIRDIKDLFNSYLSGTAEGVDAAEIVRNSVIRAEELQRKSG